MKKLLTLIILAVAMAWPAVTYVPADKEIHLDSLAVNVPRTVQDTLTFTAGSDTVRVVYALRVSVAQLDTVIRLVTRTDTVHKADTLTLVRRDTVYVVPREFRLRMDPESKSIGE